MVETVRNTLIDIADLLARYDYDERADFVRTLAATRDPDQLWATVAGLEFWGGSGAVWEVPPFRYFHPDEERAEADYRLFKQRMVDLSDLLAERGLNQLSERNAELFREELARRDSD